MNASDPDFRLLVRTAQDWRDRLQNGAVSDAELGAFEDWLAEDIRHQEIYEQAEIYWAAFDHFDPKDVDARYRRRGLALWLSDTMDQTKAFFGTAQVKLAAATAALVLIAAPITIWQFTDTVPDHQETASIITTHSAGVGETVLVTLSDGTVATLGADTEIETEYAPGKRIVRLASGAALFEVASDPDRPFSVQSDRVTATALGTVFEVRSNGGVTRVAVAEGRVEVAHPYMIEGNATSMTTRQELDTGEQIAATGITGLRAIEPVDPSRVGAWRDEMLIYKGATLTEIVADANRYSAKDIRLESVPPDIANAEINVSFRVSDIDGMIGTLPDLYPVIIDNDGETVVRIRPRP